MQCVICACDLTEGRKYLCGNCQRRPGAQEYVDRRVLRRVKYHPRLVIKNTAILSRGTGCKFMVCIEGEGNDLIAKRWCRKEPVLKDGEVLVCY